MNMEKESSVQGMLLNILLNLKLLPIAVCLLPSFSGGESIEEAEEAGQHGASRQQLESAEGSSWLDVVGVQLVLVWGWEVGCYS